MKPYSFPTKALLKWFAKNQRDLPWRRCYDPYEVWVSEVMLQQTRVDQMLPYFKRFLKRFPNLSALARANEQAVLKCWEGLGYYTRARNLHRAAKEIAACGENQPPASYVALTRLPGIGPYMAAAVASIAFNQNHAVVDGNVLRVLARFFGVRDDIRKQPTKKKFQNIADAILQRKNARHFNQALMELGALVCLPDAPLCAQCPLQPDCFALAHDQQALLPVASKKPARPLKRFAAVRVCASSGAWLVRHETRLLNGLYSFPMVLYNPLHDSKKKIERLFESDFGVCLALKKERGRAQHDYTHFRQRVVLFDAALKSKKESVTFFARSKIDLLPLTKIQKKLMGL